MASYAQSDLVRSRDVDVTVIVWRTEILYSLAMSRRCPWLRD